MLKINFLGHGLLSLRKAYCGAGLAFSTSEPPGLTGGGQID